MKNSEDERVGSYEVERRMNMKRSMGETVICKAVKTIDSGRNVGITNPF